MALYRMVRVDDAPVPVLIVPVPVGWTPESLASVPPGVDLVMHDSTFEARAFVSHYNNLETKESTGHWAVLVADLPKGETEPAAVMVEGGAA